MMYSNYPVSSAKKGSVLRFKPPGFTYPLDIPFPGRVLPVCARCKKNYKTREHCRSKEGHTGLPWTDTYICITFDATCFSPEGHILDGMFHAQNVQSSPYVYPEQVTLDPKTPSCAQCKDKNYTRTYCRMSKKHKTLPWSTVYVTLSLARNPDGSQPMPLVKSTTSPSPAAPEAGAGTDDHDQSAKKIKTNDGEGAPADAGTPSADADTDADDEIRPKDESKTSDVQEEGDLKRKKPSSDDASADDADKKGGTDESSEKKESSQVSSADSIFYKPHPSRTFLCTVSVNKNEAMWVDLDAGAAALMQHRSSKPDGTGMDVSEMPPHGLYTPHSPAYQMLSNAVMNPMGYPGMPMHPMGYPGMPAPAPGVGGKDDGNRQSNGQENAHQWGMPASGPYPTPDMMYNPQSQMMDPRMAGYGFHTGWPGGRGGYPNPMDMQGMQGVPGQMGQMPSPYDSHMMQQMPQNGGGQWGGHPGMGQPGGGQGDMPQSMPPGASPGNGMQMQGMPGQVMMQQQGMHPQMGQMGGNPGGMDVGSNAMKGGGDQNQGKDNSKDNGGSSETLQI